MSSPYQKLSLKYGCNPHQKPAQLAIPDPSPFEIINGSAGYINLLDALNAWQLVRELDLALDLPAATSFKHVSPAGAAVASSTQQAYALARGADPSASFGDMIAISRQVDLECAKFIKNVVSDGIIAPSYDADALALLSAKKKGNYLIFKANPDYQPPEEETRDVFGVQFIQKRNEILLHEQNLFDNIVTENQDLPESARQDLMLAAITLKYTQSNSVGYAYNGQMIGIGAGQQSRIACVKLAGQKALAWHLSHAPFVKALPFHDSVKSVDRINAVTSYVSNDMTPSEYQSWLKFFQYEPPVWKEDEQQAWIQQLQGVAMVSDAFFPFRDNIDQATRFGVKYILQPGAEASVIAMSSMPLINTT